jgi:hypothetical protein
MRSLGKGSLSATTQVKVLSPEISLIALGQGVHFLETKIGSHVKGESETGVPGSKAVAGKRTVHIGTWENRSVPKGSIQGVEEATRMYGVSVVGLTHSRGVNRVMPAELCVCRALEGVSGLKRGMGFGHAIH